MPIRDPLERAAYNKAYREANVDRLRTANKAYYARPENKLRQRNWMKERLAQNPDKFRWIRLKSQFGITPEDYAAMLSAQSGVCAICNEPETKRYKGKLLPLSVDHDHETGKVRGLLCDRCNRVLGFIRDNITIAKQLGEYLERSKTTLE